jgi:hypothetical protein
MSQPSFCALSRICSADGEVNMYRGKWFCCAGCLEGRHADGLAAVALYVCGLATICMSDIRKPLVRLNWQHFSCQSERHRLNFVPAAISSGSEP